MRPCHGEIGIHLDEESHRVSLGDSGRGFVRAAGYGTECCVGAEAEHDEVCGAERRGVIAERDSSLRRPTRSQEANARRTGVGPLRSE